MPKNNNTGFSILEITIAIFMIIMGFAGLVTLNIRNLQAQNVNKNNLIASQLAQEGLELVRNFRDTNWNAGVIDYYSGLYDANNLYTVDYNHSAPVDSFPDWDNILARLYIKDGFYEHNSAGTPAQFYRYIKTSAVDINNYFEVECVVYWYEKNNKHEYKTTTLLYDWK